MAQESQRTEKQNRSLQPDDIRYPVSSAFVLISAICILLMSVSLAGSIAYNAQRITLVDYLLRIDTIGSASAPYYRHRWLIASAFFGNRRADHELDSLRQTVGSNWAEADPLSIWLAVRDQQLQRAGTPMPREAWDLLEKGYAHIQAEQMLLRGSYTPGNFVSYRSESEDVHYVSLYWGLNSLEVPLVIDRTGVFQISVRAQDWPPSPLHIRIDIGDQGRMFVWDRGDYTWKTETGMVSLERGIYNLSLTYLPPQGNLTQKASVDYIEIQRIDPQRP